LLDEYAPKKGQIVVWVDANWIRIWKYYPRAFNEGMSLLNFTPSFPERKYSDCKFIYVATHYPLNVIA
jgi:hypothetical protein